MEIRSTESILKSVRVTQLKKAAVSRLDVQFPVDQYLLSKRGSVVKQTSSSHAL